MRYLDRLVWWIRTAFTGQMTFVLDDRDRLKRVRRRSTPITRITEGSSS